MRLFNDERTGFRKNFHWRALQARFFGILANSLNVSCQFGHVPYRNAVMMVFNGHQEYARKLKPSDIQKISMKPRMC